MMVARRRDTDIGLSRSERWLQQLRRLRVPQSRFSLVSFALVATQAATMLVDLMVMHENFNESIALGWMIIFIALSVPPLLLGKTFPEWFGVLFVVVLTFWATYSLLNSSHAHMELNSLFASPMVAVYLGWFYRPVVARLLLAGNLLAVLCAVIFRPPPEAHAFSSTLALIYTLCISWICLEIAAFVRGRAYEEAWRDPLTRVLNRRGLIHYGERMMHHSLRTGESLTLAVVDFDDFKAVNDLGGHAAGDAALRVVSGSWVAAFTGQAAVARTGGDEFVLVFREDRDATQAHLERVRAEAAFPWTWGLASFRPGDSLDELMKRADAELYLQKQMRDR